jgi:hypothetical protein
MSGTAQRALTHRTGALMFGARGRLGGTRQIPPPLRIIKAS